MNRKTVGKDLGRLSAEEFRKSKKMPVVVVLDNIRSAYNVGSIFRTCDAFRVEGLFLCGITACPPHREIHKTSLGATESVSWEYRKSTEDAVKELRASGYRLLVVEHTERSIPVSSAGEWGFGSGKTAVIFGNEVEGVSEEVIALADLCVEVPQFGTKHSLNVAVCSGIVLWEMTRAYRKSAT